MNNRKQAKSEEVTVQSRPPRRPTVTLAYRIDGGPLQKVTAAEPGGIYTVTVSQTCDMGSGLRVERTQRLHVEVVSIDVGE